MMNSSIRNDLRQALRTHRYERTDDGRLYLPHIKAFVGGVFNSTLNGHDARVIPNDMVHEGLDDILGVYFKQASQRTAFYIAPFSGNVTPDPATLTAANFASTQTEFIDYTESARPAWTPGAVASQSIDNAASLAVFTVNQDASTIWGFALLTAAPKQATTGLLVCCAKDTTARDNLRSGDKLNVEYDLTAQDA